MLIEERYFTPRTPVSVIAIGDGLEALLMRSILESLGAVVRLHMVATPEDFLLTLERDESDPKLVLLCGHGDERGLVFGPFEAGIDDALLVDGSLPPDAIRLRARLAGAVVLSTACLTGTDRFAAAYIETGASAYIASCDYPDGADAPLFAHLFFHAVLQRGYDAASAFEHARKVDPGFAMFQLHPNGATLVADQDGER